MTRLRQRGERGKRKQSTQFRLQLFASPLYVLRLLYLRSGHKADIANLSRMTEAV
jgi:hypothetical protein